MIAGFDSLISQVWTKVRPAWGFILRSLAVFFGSFLFFSAVPMSLAGYGTPNFFVVDVFSDSTSGLFLRWSEGYLLPKGETLLVLAPFDGFTVLMEIAAAFSVSVTLVYVTIRLVRYAMPGLYQHERRWLRRLLVMVPGLFIAGATVSLLILPWLFLWAFQLTLALGLSPTVSLTEFVATSLFLVVGLGAVFELPALAAGLAAAGVISSELLRKHRKLAASACLIGTLFIVPGIFGGLVEFPMAAMFYGLYELSIRMVRTVEKHREVNGRMIGVVA